MDASATNINSEYSKEIQSRKAKRERDQAIADATEIKRRLQLAKEGKDRFCSEKETESTLKALGYYEG
ncbi:MAG: hypothetical protein LBO70_05000 [Clostridiales Family XIII bacterium]|jgi:hypothetical protein|nr:hypothetical protein [Clostridiales Family XIII bacterium]